MRMAVIHQFNYNLQSRTGITFPRVQIIEAILRHSKLLQCPPVVFFDYTKDYRHIQVFYA